MLSSTAQKVVDQLLSSGAVSKQALEQLKLDAAKKNQPLLSLISERKIVSEEEFTKLSAKASGSPYANLTSFQPNPAELGLLPRETAKNYMAVIFGRMGGKLALAMLDPTNVQAVDFLARKAGSPLAVYQASASSIDHLLNQYKADVSEDVSKAVEGIAGQEAKAAAEAAPATARQLQTMVQDAPITRALNAILDYGVENNASDIHIEPREKELKVRFRIDGILIDTMTLPKSVEPALVSRIKILSNLKIDEHRVPQDGQFVAHSGGREVDCRIAIAPVTFGEEVVIRLLDKTNKILTLEALGFTGLANRRINEGIKRPHGMTLSTGPTGSGKTTTMYAVVQQLKNVAVNIVTLEDPVEYKMDGINQIQVNADVGLTFANGLRSILRQDPNIIMVGEIRDKETADLAVQASLTGHIVLSTLHTNSAAGVLPRLLDMQIEPFLIASTVNTVIGQRLVRRLCENCKQQVASTATQTESINKVLGPVLPKDKADAARAKEYLGYADLPQAGQNAYTLFKAVGCNQCNDGYSGRIGIYEVFSMTPNMEQLLVKRATTSEVQAMAEKEGMVTMKQDGYLKALAGITTLEEVARVAADF